MIYYEAETEGELLVVLAEIDAALGYPTNIGKSRGALRAHPYIVTERYGEIHVYKTKGGKPITSCHKDLQPYFSKYNLKKIRWDDVDVPEDQNNYLEESKE